MNEILRIRKMVEGPLPLLLSQAQTGDVLRVPCLLYVPSDDLVPTHDFVSLYACVLITSQSCVTLTRLYEEIGQIQIRDTNTVRTLSGRISLFDEHGRPITWYSKTTCRLLAGRRKDLADEYFESLESPSNDAH